MQAPVYPQKPVDEDDVVLYPVQGEVGPQVITVLVARERETICKMQTYEDALNTKLTFIDRGNGVSLMYIRWTVRITDFQDECS